jgi:hypothetical protein
MPPLAAVDPAASVSGTAKHQDGINRLRRRQ